MKGEYGESIADGYRALQESRDRRIEALEAELAELRSRHTVLNMNYDQRLDELAELREKLKFYELHFGDIPVCRRSR